MNIIYAIQALIEFLGNKVKEQPPKRIFDPECDLYNDLEKCDIMAVRTSGTFYSGIISEFTKSPYSHTQLHTESGYAISAEPNGVGFVDPIEENKKGNEVIDIFRLKGGLTRDQRMKIESKAYKSILVPYNYINLFKFPFLTSSSAVKYSGNKAFICSEHVAWCYHNAGLDLVSDRPENIEAPVDIAKSDALEYIGTYVKGVKLKENFSNKFMGEEVTFLQKLTSRLIGLFTKKDEFYSGLQVNKSKMLNE
jgi:hypothetical protein